MMDIIDERRKTNYFYNRKLNESFKAGCLLPRGVIIHMTIAASITLKELKKLAISLGSDIDPILAKERPEDFSIVYVCDSGHLKAATNEEQVVFYLDICNPIFKINKKTDFMDEKINISQLFQRYGQNLSELSTKSEEIMQLYKTYTKNLMIINKRIQLSGVDSRIQHLYHNNILPISSLPQGIQLEIHNPGGIEINFSIIEANKVISFKIACMADWSITKVKTAINTNGQAYGIALEQDSVLKVIGRQTYLLGSYSYSSKSFDESTPFMHHREIQLLLLSGNDINITAVKKSQIPIPSVSSTKIGHISNNTSNLYHKGKRVCIWNVKEKPKLSITITQIDVEMDSNFYMVKVGLFCGERLLSKVMETNWHKANEINWFENLEFTPHIKKLPLDTIICFALCQTSIKSNDSKKKNVIDISWLNIPLYNYRREFSNTANTVLMYTTNSVKKIGSLNPFGTCLPRIDLDNYPKIRFTILSSLDHLYFPSDADILKNYNTKSKPVIETSLKKDLNVNKLTAIMEMNLSVEFPDEIKSYLWQNRYHCSTYLPELLLKVLCSVPNLSKTCYIELRKMLESWPLIDPEKSMDLLLGKFPYSFVKEYCIKCLSKFSDEKLELYLTQIIQALKMETYLDNPLANFLLTRAVNNRVFAHYLFWTLFAEVELNPLNYYFIILLDIYFQVSSFHFKDLSKQVNMIHLLRKFYTIANSNKVTGKDNLLSLFKKYALKAENKDFFCNITNPLDPRQLLSSLSIDDCSVMESKKKPILLCFKNADPLGNSVRFFFKRGDDLRQDALALQVVRIMANLWDQNNQILKLLMYRVLSTGVYEGMIEHVENAKTIAKIQIGKAYSKSTLYNWLADIFTESGTADDPTLSKAIEFFYNSCAGYSIATFVIGIGDRHNDNIMMQKNGKLFHIDYGHILGNFKKFYGIKRERVPFIMIDEFLYLASKGNDTSEFYQKYMEFCKDLYITIRRSADCIIRPFTFLIDCGLPELRNNSDLDFLYTTLVLDMKEDEAANFFKSKFNIAYEGSWSTRLNFKAHNLRTENASSNIPNIRDSEIDVILEE